MMRHPVDYRLALAVTMRYNNSGYRITSEAEDLAICDGCSSELCRLI